MHGKQQQTKQPCFITSLRVSTPALVTFGGCCPVHSRRVSGILGLDPRYARSIALQL